MTTPSEIGLLRLVAQRLVGPRPRTAVEAVRHLTAAQAQDLPGALTSVALRTASRSRQDVESALDEGQVVRSWPMRGTLHVTAAEDLPWLLDLCAGRVLAGLGSRWAQLGLTAADAERARTAVVAALSGGGRLGRRELVAVMAHSGVGTDGQRGYHLLGYLAQTGTLCLGPRQDRDQQFVLLDERIPRRRRLDREEALAELALRFFRGHGPATVKDLARWSGLPLGDARTGLAAVRAELLCLAVDGAEHFLDPETPDLLAAHRDEALGPFLLPGFDEFVLGYGDRSAVLDPAFADRLVPGGNGVFRPTVVSQGRIVGTWAWTGTGARRTAVASPFVLPADDVTSAVLTLAAAWP